MVGPEYQTHSGGVMIWRVCRLWQVFWSPNFKEQYNEQQKNI